MGDGWVVGLRKPHLLLVLLLLLLYCFHLLFVNRKLFDTVKVEMNKTAIAEGDDRWGQDRPPSVAAGDLIPHAPGQCRGFYSKIQGDRSGSQIRGMLWYSLYAYRTNSTYCGACGLNQFSPVYQRLLDSMGLSGVLPLLGEDCPNNAKFLNGGSWTQNIMPDTQTLHSDVFADWRRKMTGIVQAHVLDGNGSSGGEGKRGSPCKIVAHVRRGDLDPTTAHGIHEKSKYLPNEYYIRLIEQYRRPGCRIFVHTEEAYNIHGQGARTATAEGNYDFYARNYTVIVGGREEAAWKDFVDSDFFIASKSSFSETPAMFSRGMVIFPGNFESEPMPDWIVVPVMQKTCMNTDTDPSCNALRKKKLKEEKREKSLSIMNLPFNQ